jgi:hypothetical protein
LNVRNTNKDPEYEGKSWMSEAYEDFK